MCKADRYHWQPCGCSLTVNVKPCAQPSGSPWACRTGHEDWEENLKEFDEPCRKHVIDFYKKRLDCYQTRVSDIRHQLEQTETRTPRPRLESELNLLMKIGNETFAKWLFAKDVKDGLVDPGCDKGCLFAQEHEGCLVPKKKKGDVHEKAHCV